MEWIFSDSMRLLGSKSGADFESVQVVLQIHVKVERKFGTRTHRARTRGFDGGIEGIRVCFDMLWVILRQGRSRHTQGATYVPGRVHRLGFTETFLESVHSVLLCPAVPYH